VNNMVTVNSFCDADTIPGQLLRTAANGDYFVATEANLTNLTHLTFTGWIKPNGAGDNFGAIFSSGDWCAHCDDIEGLIFDYDGNKLWYRWPGDTDEWWHNSGMTIPLNEWSYVALVVTPTAATLYLNDKKFVNTRAHNPGNIESINFGKGFYDSYFKGDMDEFTMWRRALTDAEIRNLRHVTKEDVIPTDPTLIGYWQFNDLVNNRVMDHAGQFHGNLLGAATLANSAAPVGGGVSQSFTLMAGTTVYDFAQAGAKVWMSDCEQSTGTLVATRLNVAPDAQPNTNDFPENYWILNHYDGGGGFPPLDSIQLTTNDPGFMSGLGGSASKAVVHLRSENAEGATWSTKAKATVLNGTNGMRFNRKSNVQGGTQLTLSNGAPYFDEVDSGRVCEADTLPGKALVLPGGSGNYAVVPVLNLNSNTVTISAWIKPNGLQNDNAGVIFSRGGTTTSGIHMKTNNELRYHWDGGQWSWGSGAIAPANEWSHVALVVEPTKATIYLNGVPYVNTSSHAVEAFDNVIRIGNDPNSSSRTYNGEIDEVCIWKRALTQSEVRELMHLTKEDVLNLAGQELKVYLQFNESSGKAYDKTGNRNHATLNSASVTRSTSNAPVGGGVSSRLTVSGPGVYTFGATGVKMGFAGTTPNGEVLVSKLNLPPDQNPVSGGNIVTDKTYWVVRNFGNNSFTALDSIVFDRLPGMSSLDESTPSHFSLFKRGSNAFGNTWGTAQDVADLVKYASATGGKITFSTGNGVSSFSQFVIGDGRGVLVSPKVLLQGPYNAGLMTDALRNSGLVPTNEPYTALNFVHKNGGGEETCPASNFSVTGNNAIVDWVFVELRDAATPSNVLYTRSALLQRDGDVVEMDGVSPLDFRQALPRNYYVAVRHRNHLGVMTGSSTALTAVATPLDFTLGATGVWGSNARTEVAAGVFALWAADLNASGAVDAADRSVAWNNRNTASYGSSDATLNGVTDAADRSITWNNRNIIQQLP
ncbi:MAG: LamG domain-containing protein, partial [Saprospiraceae bacterium]|nr:LamG domain-containing protein [Saprospiraceae bacterium]